MASSPISPTSKIISDEQEIFNDDSVQAVGLFTLADSRKDQIEKAIQSKKHIISEKPVADTIDKEWEVVDLVEKSDIISTVNLYLRNSWYHQIMKQFIEEGEIGELAILRICPIRPNPIKPTFIFMVFFYILYWFATKLGQFVIERKTKI